MTELTDHTMAADIEAAVRAISGVSAIYRAGGIISKVIDAGAQLLGVQPREAPLVRWEDTSDGARVDIAIGVHGSAGAAGTSRRVHDAIDALCADRGYAAVQIRITVVHVDEDTTQTSV